MPVSAGFLYFVTKTMWYTIFLYVFPDIAGTSPLIMHTGGHGQALTVFSMHLSPRNEGKKTLENPRSFRYIAPIHTTRLPGETAMNRTIRIALIPIVLIGLIITFSCSDTEHRIPIGSARVVINMGLPPETPDAELGLIERIRRLFVPDAIAQSAPAAFSSILVRVTGADIGAIEESFGPYSTISMNVPAGALRVFEVTAIVAPGDPSAAASFKGTASANCPAGQTVNVPVVMGLERDEDRDTGPL